MKHEAYEAVEFVVSKGDADEMWSVVSVRMHETLFLTLEKEP
jgi:hypothetical protein